MIFFHLILHPSVPIYICHIFHVSLPSFHGSITNQLNYLLPVGLLVQSVIGRAHLINLLVPGYGLITMTSACENIRNVCLIPKTRYRFKQLFFFGALFLKNCDPYPMKRSMGFKSDFSNSLIIHKKYKGNLRLMSVWKSDEKLLIFASLISPSKIILFET